VGFLIYMSLGLEHKYQEFNSKNNSLDAHELIKASYEFFGDKLACFSSFGSYSALLLKLVADVNKNIPVLFLETGKHFPETLQYVEDIKKTLGLKNIIALTPDEKILMHADPNGNLWSSNVDRCCWIRKVEPLDRHLAEVGYEAVITGRRAYQTKERAGMNKIELDDQGRIRINPLAFWSKDKIKSEFAELNLIQHPLVEKGYPSIGCAPCTRQIHPGEDERAGRWAHIVDLQPEAQQKTECGIHLNREDIKDFAI
jgi:phosphoadenosine phosphosulfate reductase